VPLGRPRLKGGTKIVRRRDDKTIMLIQLSETGRKSRLIVRQWVLGRPFRNFGYYCGLEKGSWHDAQRTLSYSGRKH